MYPAVTKLLEELEREAGPTRRLIERIPPDRLAWRPHPKSMTLGELALHVALVPGAFADWLRKDGVDMATVSFRTQAPESIDAVQCALDRSLDTARSWLRTLDEAAATAIWRVTVGGSNLPATPRIDFIRALMFNHWYHHRGQLAVYLRLLNVAVPPVYGPSADENPFAEDRR